MLQFHLAGFTFHYRDRLSSISMFASSLLSTKPCQSLARIERFVKKNDEFLSKECFLGFVNFVTAVVISALTCLEHSRNLGSTPFGDPCIKSGIHVLGLWMGRSKMSIRTPC